MHPKFISLRERGLNKNPKWTSGDGSYKNTKDLIWTGGEETSVWPQFMGSFIEIWWQIQMVSDGEINVHLNIRYRLKMTDEFTRKRLESSVKQLSYYFLLMRQKLVMRHQDVVCQWLWLGSIWADAVSPSPLIPLLRLPLTSLFITFLISLCFILLPSLSFPLKSWWQAAGLWSNHRLAAPITVCWLVL